jgi:hypothetical protein
MPVKRSRSGMTSYRGVSEGICLRIDVLANRERKFCPFPDARASGGTPHLSGHDLQCGIDDVIRRTLDEGRVLIDRNCDLLLQFVFALRHLRRSINDRHDFSFLISSWLNWTRAEHLVNRVFPCSLGWSDRHGSGGNEVGSLQPIPGVFPACKMNVAPCATSTSHLLINYMPPRTTRKSYRLRASDRTMVGTLQPHCLSHQKPQASSRQQHESAKKENPKSLPTLHGLESRAQICARSSRRGNFSLDSPLYRTP